MPIHLPASSPGAFLPIEAEARRDGFRQIAGVDEVGRGCLAGPVVAAAVIFSEHAFIPGVADSKLLSPAQREEFASLIRRNALAVGEGWASPEEVDSLNILRATLLAMQRALAALSIPPDLVVVDGNIRIPSVSHQRTLVKGDRLCFSIASASIVAKVARDQYMIVQDIAYPGYDFAQHKGYGTQAHLRALDRLGPCPLHRRSFRGVLPELEVGSSQGGQLSFLPTSRRTS